MRFAYLIALVLVAVTIAVFVGWKRSSTTDLNSGSKGWVANSGYLGSLPQFRALVSRSRWILGASLACFGLAVVSVAVSAGAPVDRRIADERLASRDIVLCLDASGSMIPYDGQIGQAFQQIVEHFSGERISLQLWNARTSVKFPLTDDYDLALSQLEEMTTVIREGYQGKDSSGVWVSHDLLTYLKELDDPNEESSSLAGDGLASCVLGFDHTDTERSRLIILATDNEVLGSQIYTLEQAMRFAKDQDVIVTSLFPGSDFFLGADGEELKKLTEMTGGVFYDASDPSSVQGIIQEIESLQRVELDKNAKVVETDRPEAALGWLVTGVLFMLGLLALGRL